MADAWKTILPVFHAHAPPDVGLQRGESKLGPKEPGNALRPFCQDLKGVPLRGGHDLRDGDNVFVGNLVVEEIAHGIDKDHLRSAPAQRLPEFSRNEAKIKSLLIGMAFDAAKALGERLGVATFAIFVQPRTGFQVASVHSMEDCNDITVPLGL